MGEDGACITSAFRVKNRSWIPFQRRDEFVSNMDIPMFKVLIVNAQPPAFSLPVQFTRASFSKTTKLYPHYSLKKFFHDP
jgi:hypothetical protein